MKVIPLVLCLTALATPVRADKHCVNEYGVNEYGVDTCGMGLPVKPMLEDIEDLLGYTFSEMVPVSLRLTTTDEGQPLVKIRYIYASDPMTDDKLESIWHIDLSVLSDIFRRDLFDLHCGHPPNLGQRDHPLTFVQAGGAVSYEIQVHLKNSAGDSIVVQTFGQTTIKDCKG